MGAVLAIARMIIAYPVSGLAAFWHLLRHCPFPNTTLMDKPQSIEEQQNKRIARNVEGISDEESREMEAVGAILDNSTPVEDPEDYYVPCPVPKANTYNSKHPASRPILNDFMKALADPHIHIIGVCGDKNDLEDGLIPKVRRRIDRDKAFDVVLTATVTKKPKVRKNQDEIAGPLGFKFNKKSEGERASELLHRIKGEQKVVIILLDVYKGLDLGKVGIPFGEHHKGCKIVISSSDANMFFDEPTLFQAVFSI